MTKQEANIILQKDRTCRDTNPQKCYLLHDKCEDCPKYVTYEEVEEAHKVLNI